MLLPFVLFVILPTKMLLHYGDVEAAAFAKVRTVPAIVYDHKGNTGFTWVHTIDSRPILMCFTEYPFPDVVDCHIATGEEYAGGVRQTISEKVAIIHPPQDI